MGDGDFNEVSEFGFRGKFGVFVEFKGGVYFYEEVFVVVSGKIESFIYVGCILLLFFSDSFGVSGGSVVERLGVFMKKDVFFEDVRVVVVVGVFVEVRE